MKKILWTIAAVIIVAAAALLWAGSSRVHKAPLVPVSDKDGAAYIESQTLSFLEDIRFKDFAKAARYHSIEEQKVVDIPQLIENIFKVKPELLDIMRYEVLSVELDSTQTRGRVKTRTVIKLLNTDEIREPEIIFFWDKHPQQGWVMRLQSSLHD